ncbi:unnamed protein product [Protopolystoma xenopodis]|uniref:Uncharacterized protein n=1 Tax=Protopolystoma xenopodis TaxID=117903 RepID=A0A3S4ZD50_9PLAT|nr:unnamed protein product [Protopolystoma xenopodis]
MSTNCGHDAQDSQVCLLEEMAIVESRAKRLGKSFPDPRELVGFDIITGRAIVPAQIGLCYCLEPTVG